MYKNIKNILKFNRKKKKNEDNYLNMVSLM